MKVSKRVIISIISIIFLVLVIISAEYLLNKDEPTMMTYDLDASDSIHYQLGEEIEMNNEKFILHGYQIIQSVDNKNVELKLEINMDKDTYNMLHDRYSFKLANEDRLLLETDCSYKNENITIIDFLKEKERPFNQIVIVDNKNQKILITISLGA